MRAAYDAKAVGCCDGCCTDAHYERHAEAVKQCRKPLTTTYRHNGLINMLCSACVQALREVGDNHVQ